MKKIINIMLFALLIFLLLSLVPLSSFAFSSTDAEEITKYLSDKIIPVAVAVLSLLGTLYVGVVPVINKVKNASDKFSNAANDVRKSNINYLECEKLTRECIERIDEIAEKNNCEIEKINRILMTAFCNNDELVKKGYARKIAQMLENEERTENDEEKP